MAIVDLAEVDLARLPVVGQRQQVLGRVDDVVGDAQRAADDVGRAARQHRDRDVGPREPVGDLVQRPVAAKGDDHVVAVVAHLAPDLGRVVLRLGVDRLDLIAALQRVDHEVLEPVETVVAYGLTMISIRFLARARGYPARLDSGSPRRRSSFAHPAFVDQQVGVADHLGEGEEGLGDGDVAPDRLGDLVAAARPLGDQAVDLLLAALVLGDAVVDQGDVVDDRLAVAGEDDLGRHLARLSHRLDVGDERLRCARSEPSSGRVISGLEEMWAIRWSAAIRILRSSSQKTVSEGLCPGRWSASQGAVAELDRLAVVERPGDRRRASPSRGSCARRCAGRRDLLGDAVAQHQLDREAVLALGVLVEVGEPLGGDAERRHLGAGVLDDDLDQAEVVDVLVGEDDQLEVVDRVAALGELASQLVERLARVGAGVDQGQRLVLDQVAVDPADRERRRDRGGGGCRPAPPARAPPRGSGSRPDQPQDLVALRLHVLARDQRLEVEAQQRLGVGGADVEVPVGVVDRDPVEAADCSPSP